MKNQSKIRKTIIRSLLALSLTAGVLMPLTASAWDGQDPQEGGRTRRGSGVTCTVTTYNIIIATMVVTDCSDGTHTITLS